MKSADRVRVTSQLNENTETASSPLTYAFNKSAAASTILPDKPTISNIEITSAVCGVPPSFWGGKTENEEEQTNGGFPATTSRVTKLSFDMSNVSPPIANLFRRIIVTEVPTIAFDRVLIEENDSVVIDEMLSHRIGLVPLAGPVDEMEYITSVGQGSFQNLDPKRVLTFEVDVTGKDDVQCTPVYSGDLKWVPLPGQEEWKESEDVFLVHPDIMLTKLGPRQRLKVKVLAVKGIGLVHTKWSPVSACFYEMKTAIDFTEPVTGKSAEKLVQLCPRKVFELEDGAAVVKDPSKCSLCRECLRKDAYPEIADAVSITKLKTAVRFHIESVGQLHATTVFRTALTLFAERCRDLAQQLQNTEVNMTGKIGTV